MPPEQLLQVRPITEVDGVLEYSERTMRTIAALIKPLATTEETHSAFVRRFLQSLEPWTTVEKTQGGKMTKRVGAYIFKDYGVDLPPRYVAAVGNFLNDEAPVGKLHYDQTNKFNWNAGDFGDGNACFITSRRHVLDAMMDEGGHALRFWKPIVNGVGHKGVGRAWVLPTKLGVPVVMNAYGPTLESYRARMRLIVPDAPTTMVMVNNMGSRDGSLYVNGGHGFLVGHEGEDYELDVDLEIGVGQDRPVRCIVCAQRMPRRNAAVVYDEGDSPHHCCSTCAASFYGMCIITGRHYPKTLLEMVTVIGRDMYKHELGYSTAEAIAGLANPHYIIRLQQCPKCDLRMEHHSPLYHVVDEGRSVRMCGRCAASYPLECAHCGNFLKTEGTCLCGGERSRHRSY
jgi:hypothetical protein